MDRPAPVRPLRPRLAAGLGVALGLGLLAAVLPRERAARHEPRPDDVPRAEIPTRPDPPRAPADAGPRGELPRTDPPRSDRVEPARPPSVVVDVVDEEGRPAEGAQVVGIDCPGFPAGAVPPGEYPVDPGACVLRAVRADGALFTRSPAASVEAVGPDPAYLQLELPSRRTGGIGVRFVPAARGVEVIEVLPGGPAEQAGLVAGDRIVAVGGEAVTGKDADWFVDRMTGPVGSAVVFTLEAEGDTGLVEHVVRVTRDTVDDGRGKRTRFLR